MSQTEDKMIEALADRSDRTLLWIAIAFALGGAMLDAGAQLVSNLFMKESGVTAFWGLWIPFCMLVIPSIHFLCRRVRHLEKRINALTHELENRPAA